MLIGASGNLTGLFTDSDLARLFETRRYEALDQPIREVMTKRPRTIASGSILSEAVTLMAEHKISELPVVDSGGRPVGLIDVTDIVGMIPEEKPGHTAAKSATAIFGITSDQNAPEIQKHSNRRRTNLHRHRVDETD